MYCRNCGAQLADSQKFCTACGAPTSQQPPYQSPPGTAQKYRYTDGRTVGDQYPGASRGSYYVRTADPLIICALVFSFVFAPVGLILGLIGWSKHKNDFVSGEKAMTIASIAISLFAIVATILTVIGIAALIELGNNHDFRDFFESASSAVGLLLH